MMRIHSTENQRKSLSEAKRFYFKAQDALKTGKWIKAIQYLKMALQIKKDYQPACRDLAEIYQQHGDLNEAEQYVKRSLDINPSDPVTLFIRGVIHITRGEIHSALQAFKKVEGLGEMTWELAYNLGLCYYGLKHYNLSIPYLNKAMQKNPLQPQPYMLLAQIYMMENKIDLAKQILIRAKKVRPLDRQLDIWLSRILHSTTEPKG
jgi:tetratricopeptide (TPR) repeat protein